MSHLVLLDNEAVQALSSIAHPKHRKVLSYIQVVANRKRSSIAIELAVPTAVRVEAGWDRTESRYAFANSLRITDLPLDITHTNIGAAIANSTGLSVADAHMGAVIRSTESNPITIITSDPQDMRLTAGNTNIRVVSI